MPFDPLLTCLSIDAPWAWLIIAGHKRWENRSWATRHRGRLWIHATASKRSDAAATAVCAALGIDLPALDALRGRVLGWVDLADCIPRPDAAGGGLFAQDDSHGLLGDPFATGPICWELARPVALEEPLAIAGQQGLWTLPAHFISG